MLTVAVFVNIMRFYCTAGRGTEPYVVKELRSVGGEQIISMNGKVFFGTDNISKLLVQLKSVERIFAHIYQEPAILFDVRHLSKSLKNRNEELQSALKTWQFFNLPNRSDGNLEKEKYEDNEMPCKRQKLEATTDSVCSDLTFRVSCKCTGKASRHIQPQHMASVLGKTVSQLTGMKVNLSCPQLEISVHANNEGTTIGIPLTKKPLSDRAYLRHIGLRSPVCWIMAYEAGIQRHDIVLDPMCGTSTLIIEAEKLQPDALYFYADFCEGQLQKAKDNIAAASVMDNSMLARAQSLPLRDGTVSVILCDMPFGINHGSVENMKLILPKVLLNMNRVLQVGGRVVLLTGVELKKTLLQTVDSLNKCFWRSCAACASSRDSLCQSHTGCSEKATPHTDPATPPRTHPASTQWLTKTVHYLKLGNTHSFMCSFEKSLKTYEMTNA